MWTGAGGTSVRVCGESGRKESVPFRKELFSCELRARFAQGKLIYMQARKETRIARKLAQAPWRRSSLRPRFD